MPEPDPLQSQKQSPNPDPAQNPSSGAVAAQNRDIEAQLTLERGSEGQWPQIGNTLMQCWGSACLWASRIRLRIHKSEVRIRILPFSHKCAERTEIMLEKNMLTQSC